MLKQSFRFLLIAIAFLVGSPFAFSQMSDQAVIDYAKSAHAAGKDKNTIAAELMAKGVTKEQVERIQASLGGGGESAPITSGVTVVNEGRTQAVLVDAVPTQEYHDTRKSNVFGHDIFTNKNLTFEPNVNMATPSDYRLGPGDNVYINIFGESEDNMTATISPEGSIILSQIGPVYLNGLTVEEANNRLRRLFAQKYAGFDNHQSDVNLTLGDVRSIMVNIMGEVDVPGTYRLSPFSSIFSALYSAGGVKNNGSVRNVKVIRNGKEIVTIDLYEYLFNGKTSDNIRLQEGDVIMVPIADRIINTSGSLKRPMQYEMLPEETLSDLIRYAGGFTSSSASDNIVVTRWNGTDRDVMNISEDDYPTFTLRDGDNISIGNTSSRIQNQVTIGGAVLRPGTYALDGRISSVRDLIEIADGVLEDAYLARAILYRLDENRDREILAIDLESILNGTAPDVPLRREDNLVIYSRDVVYDFGTVSINGMVNNPGTFPFATDVTIDDLIIRAGGLRQGASYARIDIARRVIDPWSLTPTNEIAKIYQFHVNEGFVTDPDSTFVLMPYDVVTVRRSPGYETQRFVTISGEVVFPGAYALQTRTERISDVIRRAGGLTESSYAGGASLRRRATQDETLARQEMRDLVHNRRNSEDSISIQMLDLSAVYTIGINLEKALANPGSTYDIVLREGDVLTIPEMMSTVSISGDVMYPNTVTYIPGKNFKYYVDQAGGFGKEARKKKCYIVYMNGEVAMAKGKTKIEPGAQIIVPTKGEGKATDWAQLMTVSSMVASLATMVATFVNVVKK